MAATLGIADHLADGPRTSGELATATGTDPDTLYRLLRALAALGVVHEDDGRRFSLAPLGEPLRTDDPQSLHAWAVWVGSPALWQGWGNLLHSVRTGENAFRDVFGTDVWEYRRAHPEDGAIFDRAMAGLTSGLTEAVLDAYDFGKFGTVVDIGGGSGSLLAAILVRHPHVSGVLFDAPNVVGGAERVLHDAGVAARVRVVGGNFFEEVPGSGDVYVLKSIIHDWNDEAAIAILRVVRRAMSDESRLVLVELDLGRPNENVPAKLSDLNMLVMPYGRERTVDEYAALFQDAGLRVVGVHPTGTGSLVIEGRAV